MPGKRIYISTHARFEMKRRGIKFGQVLAAIRNPGQILPSRKGRNIYQSKLGGTRQFLLRVIIKEDKQACHVVTVYKTSKVSKYWRQP